MGIQSQLRGAAIKKCKKMATKKKPGYKQRVVDGSVTFVSELH